MDKNPLLKRKVPNNLLTESIQRPNKLEIAIKEEEYDENPVIASLQKERYLVLTEMQSKRQDASYQQLAQALSQLNKDIQSFKNPQNQESLSNNVVAININLPDGSSRQIIAHTSNNSQNVEEDNDTNVIDI